MAENDLIARYLEDLEHGLGTHVRHADRIRAEIEDHLRSSSDQMRAAGLSEADANRRAIECFGPVEELASTFITLEDEGAGARASRFTTRAGLLGAIGGFIIALAAAIQVADDRNGDAADQGVGAVVGTVGLVAAIVMVGVGFAGIVARHRGALRRIDRVALGLLALGLVTMWLPFWGILVIAVPLMLIGTILFGIRVYRVHALPRPPIAFMLLAGASLVALTVTKSDKSSIEFATGWVLVLAGWCWLQFTLWSERPERAPQTT